MEGAVRNQARFDNAKTLVVTGERAEESASRAKYNEFEPDRSDARKGRKARLVDHWRPVHKWEEQQVWDAMADLHIIPHPAYRLGWGRLSCMACIFGSKNQWASVKAVSEPMFEAIRQAEALTGKTIHRTKSVTELAAAGQAYGSITDVLADMALSREYVGGILTDDWKLPAGAFGESVGPT